MRTHDTGSRTSSVAWRALRIVLSTLLALSICPLVVRAEEDATNVEVPEAEVATLAEDASEVDALEAEAVETPEAVEEAPADIEEPAAVAEEPAEVVDDTVELDAEAEGEEGEEPSTYDLSQATIEPIADQTYTGKEIRPELTVTLDGKVLTEGADADYTASYAQNTTPGTATVTITGTGDYTGTCEATFTIVPMSIEDATVSGLSNKTYTGSAFKPVPTVKVTLDGATVTLKNGTDYTVAYKNNTNAGTATVTITGKGNYAETVTKTFTISPASLKSATVTVAAQTYTGKKLTPAPTVKLGNKMLKKDTDYTFSYSANQNAGTATVTITGKGNYTGTTKGNFTIRAASLSKATVSSIAQQKWDGKAKKPVPTIKLGGVTLKNGTDFTLTYKNNVNPNSTATITITGKGNYSGTKSVTFKIGPKTGEWKKSNGLWWYRWADGSYPKSQFLTLNGSTYYFDAEGWMVTGWEKLGGNWFYFDTTSGAMKSGWLNQSGTWYWMESNGKMATGWKKISGSWYWFNSSGAMVTGLKKIGGKVYYLSDSGAMVTGWTQINGAWYHFDSNGAASSGWYKVGSSWYWGSENGRMATGWKTLNNVRYYLDPTSGAMATGWKKISDRWYYFESSGALAKSKWIGDYYVGVNGYMYTDRYTPDGYYVDKNGKWDGKPAVKVVAR